MSLSFGPKKITVMPPASASDVTVTHRDTDPAVPATLTSPVTVTGGQIAFTVAEPGRYTITVRFNGFSREHHVNLYPDAPDLSDDGKLRAAVESASTAADVAHALAQELDRRPERFGARPDGITDSTAAINQALAASPDTELSPGTYRITGTLVVPEGHTLRGAGGGQFGLGSVVPQTRILIASNTASTAVTVAEKGIIRDVYLVPENLSAVSFQAANYPSGTGNCSTGVSLADSAAAENVVVNGFAVQGFLTSNRAKISGCYAGRSKVGYTLGGPDGTVFNSVATFCHDAGMQINANFWRIVGCRLEWNARYGISAAAEGTYVGNLFDRNGWAGLYLPSGSWGHVITGNDFTRNGVGGNGNFGRWGVSTPAHASYVETAETDSCHIKMAFQRGVTITGNRFRTGQDDASQGANGPFYIYSFGGSDGSTGSTNFFRAGNAGETGAVLGYVQGNGTYAGTSAGAGGTDTGAINVVNRGERFAKLISAPGYGVTRSQSSSVSSLSILPEQSYGTVYLRGTTSSIFELSEIYFGQNAGTGNTKTATVSNKVGTLVSAATRDADGTIQITLAGSRFTSYNIIYTG